MANQLKENQTLPKEEQTSAAPIQDNGQSPFVIYPSPSDEPVSSSDGIYSDSDIPYMDAVVREESSHIQVSCVLICGNVGLMSEEAIRRVAESYRVVIAGTGEKFHFRERKIHYYDAVPTEEKFIQLFDAFDIDAVWYISGYADGLDGMHDEYKGLECIMGACVKNAVSKFIVVSSVESLNFQSRYDIMGRHTGRSYASSGAFASAQLENYIRYYSQSYGLKTIILRAPYIATEQNRGNFLGRIFDGMINGSKLVFPYCPENKVDFLSDSDLVELLMDVSEENADETASYSVTSGYHYTWKDLEDEILRAAPETAISYAENVNFISVQSYSIELKRKYGFIPMVNVLSGFSEAFQTYLKNLRKESLLNRFLRKAGETLSSNLMGYIELVVFFLLAELLVKVTGVSVYFKYVDIRLFYVVIMGTIYGTRTGIMAGILECVALFMDYRNNGINGIMLFYNIDNWLPFVLYIMTGSITGYVSLTRRHKNEFLKRENDLLREKYLFLNDVYHGAIENKGEYKRQILGYKDSFGVIFQAVRKLDSVLPHEIFMNGIQIMEGILKNHTIAIYTVDKWQRFGRLVACSGEIMDQLRKSIELESMVPVCDTIRKGEVWKNTELMRDIPMYAYGVLAGEKISLMIFIYEASPEQMSLYYFNLFSILCNLIKLSFIRALEYQQAIEQEKYYPDTLVVIPSYFQELLTAQKNMMDAGFASYALIRFECRDKRYISDAVKGLIRNSDILGADDEEQLYLILTQITPRSIKIVTDRLEQKGLKFEIISGN